MRISTVVCLCLAVAIVSPLDAAGTALTGFESSTILAPDTVAENSIVRSGTSGVASGDEGEPGDERTNTNETFELAPGRVDSVPAEWVTGPVGFDASPKGEWLDGRLVVKSPYGIYVFHQETSDFEVSETLGETDVRLSFFTVEDGDGLWLRRQSRIKMLDGIVTLQYDVARVAGRWGQITLSIDFRDQRPPKITVFAEPDANAEERFESTRIIWVVSTPFGAFSNGPQSIAAWPSSETRIHAQTTRAWIGEIRSGDSLKRHITVDWSGEVAAVSLGTSGQGDNALLVRFKEGRFLIDPFLVASSVDDSATISATQRKVFTANELTWSFYLQGNAIKYRTGRLVENTMKWGDPATAVPEGNGLTSGFDVTQAGNTVVVAWTDMHTSVMKLYVRIGALYGDRLEWADISEVPEVHPSTGPTVAIGTNGDIWVATGYTDGAQPPKYYLHIWQAHNGVWMPVHSYETTNYAFPVLLPFSEGRIAVVYLVRDSPEVCWRFRDQHFSPFSPWQYGCYPAADIEEDFEDDALSAVGTEVSSGIGYYVAYANVVYVRKSDHHLIFLRLRMWPGPSGYITDLTDSGDSSYPSITADTNNNLHAMWIQSSQIKYRRNVPGSKLGDPLTWGATQDVPPGPRDNPKGLTVGYHSFESLFALWQEGSSGSYSVQMAMLPLPSSSLIASPDPWSRIGLSQDSPTIAQGTEYIGVGNGGLIVRQTDVSVPGRGLDVELSRIYIQAEVFGDFMPYGYEENPTAPMCRGWRLNIPWISPSFVYWMDGQRYLIHWSLVGNGIAFDNHQGAQFHLTSGVDRYELTDAGGVLYTFHKGGGREGTLDSIEDVYGNSIVLTYSSGKLSRISETMPRDYDFGYDSNSGCINKISYALGSKVVEYEYMQNLGVWTLHKAILKVTGEPDVITEFDYDSSQLLSEIRYATGGHSKYTYDTAYVGSESWSYPVVSQKFYENAAESSLVRSVSYYYESVWGRIVYAKVTVADNVGIKGITQYSFDRQTTAIDTRISDAAGNELKRTRAWYTAAGAVASTETFLPGAITPSYTSEAAFDEWGNQIYTRTPSGRESFASFANTERQNVFSAPGRFERESSGLYLHEDFTDRITTDWHPSGDGGASIDKNEFMSTPPSLRIDVPPSPPPNTLVETIYQDFSAQDAKPVYAEFRVLVGDTAGRHDVRLQLPILGDRVCLRFGSDGELKYSTSVDCESTGSYTSFTKVVHYTKGSWNRLGIWFYWDSLSYSFKWDFWLDGKLWQQGILALIANDPRGVTRAFMKIYPTDTAAAIMWISEVNVYKSRDVTVNGLEAGKAVRLLTLAGAIQGQKKVPASATSVTVTASPLFPQLRLEVLGIGLALEAQSPFLEIFGGDVYDYTPPWSKGGLAEARKGFTFASETPGTVFLGDQFSPPGPYTTDGNELDGLPPPPPPTWTWWYDGRDGLPLPVTDPAIHYGKYYYDAGSHRFWGGTTQDPRDYLIQFIYIPSGQTPDEIRLSYCVWLVDHCEWGHRAKWGWDVLPDGGTYMGTVPERRDQWLLIVIPTSQIIDQAQDHLVKGIAYEHYGGNLSWDYSASISDIAGQGGPGKIVINGPQTSLQLVLEDGTVIDGITPNVLDLSASGYRVFPLRGQFKISSAAGLEYISPMFDDLMGGDIYSYGTPGFYTNEEVITGAPYVHNRMVGALEFQNGREQIPQMTFVKYDAHGFALEKKQSHGAGWVISSQIPDSYGNVISVQDPELHVTSYLYDDVHSCQYYYPWKEVRNLVDPPNTRDIVTQYAYNCQAGLPTTVTDPLNHATDYQYDDLGRLTLVTYPPVFYRGIGWSRDSKTYQYTPNVVTFIDERGHQSQQIFDGLGRLVTKKRLSSAGNTEQKWTYNWQGLVESEESAEHVKKLYQYDLFGRLIKTWYDGETASVDIAYLEEKDEVTSTVSDELDHKRDLVYDLDGNLIRVCEYSGPSPCASGLETLYTYDRVGNLKTITDAKTPPETTTYDYDDLNRLEGTFYPDGTSLSITYDDDGKVHTRTDGLSTALFEYDTLDRITTVTFGAGTMTYGYGYNDDGTLAASSNGGNGLDVVTDYLYDARHRVTEQGVAVTFGTGGPCSTVNPDADRNTFNFDWTKDSKLWYLTYPDGTMLTYGYDDFDRVIVVSGVVQNVLYNKDDQMTFLDFTDGSPDRWDVSYSYIGANEHRGRLTGITYLKNNLPDLEIGYDYWPDNNIQQIDVGMNTETFQYDEFERLTHADGEWGSVTYTYDDAGNRETMTDNGGQTFYAYNTWPGYRYNRLKSTDAPGLVHTEYEYDNNGNVVEKIVGLDPWTFNYDLANRLDSVEHPTGTKIQCNGYDSEGRRARVEQLNPPSFRYKYLWIDSLLMYIGDSLNNAISRFVYIGSQLVARVDTTPADSFLYLQDHLGSTRMVVKQSNGQVVYQTNYKPFGIEFQQTGQEQIKYVQRPWDDQFGQYYLLHRYYDPQLGRFLAQDPVQGTPTVPQTLNRYTYATNNPLRYSDPDGDFIFLAFLGAILVGAVISTAVYAVTCGNSCSLAGYAGAFFGGAVAGAIGYLTAGAGFGWAVLGGAGANLAAYSIQSLATGTFTLEGLFFAGATGAGMGALGYGIGKAVGQWRGAPTKGLPDDDVLVVRGGRVNTGNLIRAEADGISVSSAPGRSVAELAGQIPTRSGRPYTTFSVTNRGALRSAGAEIIPDPLPGYPSHALVYPGRGGAPSIRVIWWEWP